MGFGALAPTQNLPAFFAVGEKCWLETISVILNFLFQILIIFPRNSTNQYIKIEPKFYNLFMSTLLSFSEDLKNKEFLIEVINQLNKDFSKIGLTIEIPSTIKAEKVSELLLKIIDKLSHSTHSDKIQQLLYCVDVPEEVITDVLNENTELDYNTVIAFTILRREIQKVMYRKNNQLN